MSDNTLHNINNSTISDSKRRCPESAQSIFTFFGACSGDVLGKVTVRTPSAIEALISSGCDAAHEYASQKTNWDKE